MLQRVADEIPVIVRRVRERAESLRSSVQPLPGETRVVWGPLRGPERASAYMAAIS